MLQYRTLRHSTGKPVRRDLSFEAIELAFKNHLQNDVNVKEMFQYFAYKIDYEMKLAKNRRPNLYVASKWTQIFQTLVILSPTGSKFLRFLQDSNH